jgi:Glycosyltransferase family 10 (fucosyltransferase) C-term
MVSIRRPAAQTNSKKTTPSSLSKIRNAVVLLLVLQGVRLMWLSSSSSNNGGDKKPEPQSLQAMLQSGKAYLKKDLTAMQQELKGLQHQLPQNMHVLGDDGKGEPEEEEEEKDPYSDVDDAQRKPAVDHAVVDATTSREGEDEEAEVGEAADLNDHEHDDDDDAHRKHDAHVTTGQQQQQQHKGNDEVEDEKLLEPDSLLVLKKHGTGPTRVGFVQDFVHERAHAAFRNLALPEMDTLESKVSQLLSGGESNKANSKVKSCQSYSSIQKQSKNQESTTSILPRWLIQESDHCKPHDDDSDVVLIAYNGADFPRTLCGQVLEPHSAVHLAQDVAQDDHDSNNNCHSEPAHVLPSNDDVDPPVHGQGGGMPPIVVVHSSDSQQQPVSENVPLETISCDIPCQFEKGIMPKTGFATLLYIQGTPWKLAYTNADPYFDASARMERLGFQKDVYYATTSLKSSVPLSFYNFDDYNLRKAPVLDWNTAGNAATYVLDSNCVSSSSRRHKWQAAVAAAMKVESYGSCHHNTDLKPGETIDTAQGRIALMKKNRIALALEAGTDKDHMTSITWEALMSGAVLAYMGPSNAHEILPSPKTVLNANGFNNWDKFGAFVKNISESKELWESYQSWRTDEQALSAFERRFNFTRTSPQCRICRWAYAKRYGLGWNHEQQIVTETYVPRTFCVQKEEPQLVTKPFREVWMQRGTDNSGGGADDKDGSSCSTPTTSLPLSRTTVELDHYQVERSVLRHDGITDMDIHKITMGTSQNESVVLRLEFSPHVRNSDGAYFRNTHTLVPNLVQSPLVSSASIQDENAKITILANWVTTITSPQEGMMEIVIQGGGGEGDYDDQAPNAHRRRLRIIIEDFNPLHDKLTEYSPSHFCKIMTKDFVDPVLLFYPDT